MQFLKDSPPTEDGYHWYRHKDSDVTSVGFVKGLRCYQLGTDVVIPSPAFALYLWSDVLTQPAEKPLGLQMAEAADNNKLLTPREMIADVLAAMADPKDVMSRANKAIFIGVHASDENYHTATLRCNMSNSEAVALMACKTHEYCAMLTGQKDVEP